MYSKAPCHKSGFKGLYMSFYNEPITLSDFIMIGWFGRIFVKIVLFLRHFLICWQLGLDQGKQDCTLSVQLISIWRQPDLSRDFVDYSSDVQITIKPVGRQV